MREVIVVTRFAIQWPGERYPDEEFMQWRFMLLNVLAGRLMGQARVPLWWVWLAEKEQIDLAERMAATLPYRIVVTTPDVPTDSRVAPTAREFLTYRLDSDDAFLPSAFCPDFRYLAPRTIVDFAGGLQWDLRNGHWQLLRTKRTWQGPFLAITHESRDEMLNFGGHHIEEARAGRRVMRIRRPAWVQTIHDVSGGNKINHMVNVSPRRLNRNQVAFPLPSWVGKLFEFTRDASELASPHNWMHDL